MAIMGIKLSSVYLIHSYEKGPIAMGIKLTKTVLL